MNKNEKQKVIATVTVKNSNENRGMPLFEKDVLVFVMTSKNFIEEVPEDTEHGIREWTRINGKNGSISATQLLRKGNGINLSGENNTDRLRSLLTDYSDEDGVFSVLVREIRERGERRYYVLSAMSGERELKDFVD